ncbi:MAG: MlaD family protein [Solirubrobacteraceae bacterium]
MKIEYRGAKVMAIIAFLALCLGIFVWLFGLAGGRMLEGSSYTAVVRMPDAFQLVSNADVRSAGVKVGKVREVTNDGDQARVTISLDDDHAPLNKDATIKLRTKTLVGENYLELIPGSPRAGTVPSGGTLPLERAGESVQLDQILSSIDRETRREVQRNLKQVGPGLEGRGNDTNELFKAMPPTVDNSSAVARVLDGQREQLGRVVDQGGQLLKAFANRSDDVRALAGGLRRTTAAVADRDAALREGFRELPATLEQIQSTAGRLGSVARESTPVVASLRTGVRSLPPVTSRLAAAASDGRRIFRILPSVSRRADPLLESLREFSKDANPVIPQFAGFLRQVNPALRYIGPRAEDMVTAIANLGSATDSRDDAGHLARVHVVVSEKTVTGLGVTDLVERFLDLTGASSVFRSRLNSYPVPGTRDAPQPFKPGDYAPLKADPPIAGADG